jgi:acyl-CoA synthetase (NDP forming)
VPVLVNCLGAPTAPPRLQAPDGRRLPVYPFPETAIRALSRAVEYAEWRERPQGVVPDLDGVDEPAVRAIVDDYVADQPAGGWPPPQAAARLLAAVGVTVLPVVAAASDHEVTAAAARCGYPVALKTAAPDVVHKTDVGGVRLGLADRHTLVRAYDEMTETTGDPRVTVQPMAPNGVELVAGLNRDDLFGPVLMAGAGGVLTDLLADRQWRGLPLTDLDAADLVRSLRCAPLLAGYRGQPAADEGAVLDVLHRIARLAELAPEVAELDVNPLVAAPGGAFAVDVKVRLLPAPAIPDAYDRRLR